MNDQEILEALKKSVAMPPVLCMNERRCGLSELQAINILNGFHVKDYIAIKEREYAENERRKAERDQDT